MRFIRWASFAAVFMIAAYNLVLTGLAPGGFQHHPVRAIYYGLLLLLSLLCLALDTSLELDRRKAAPGKKLMPELAQPGDDTAENPGPKSKLPCLRCGSTRKRHHAKGYCRSCYERERNPGSSTRGARTRWSMHGNQCIKCWTQAAPHHAKGYCKSCYQIVWREGVKHGVRS